MRTCALVQRRSCSRRFAALRTPPPGRRRSLPGRASEPARAKEPIVRFPVQLCFVSKYNSEQLAFPQPFALHIAILCDPPARGTPTSGLGHLRAKSLAAQPHIFRRCPPGCAYASGLLLTPPRAMLCEPALCGSIIASSRLTGAMPTHVTLVQRRSCSRRLAALRTPPPGRCLATQPVAGRRAGSVNYGQNVITRTKLAIGSPAPPSSLEVPVGPSFKNFQVDEPEFSVDSNSQIIGLWFNSDRPFLTEFFWLVFGASQQ